MTTFRIGSQELYKDIYEYVRSVYNKTMTMDIISELKHVAKEPYYVEKDGEKSGLDAFIAPKKIAAFTSDEASRLLALFISDTEVLRSYFDSLPETYKRLMNLLLRRKYISFKEMKSMGFESCVSESKSRYYYYDEVQIAAYRIWFDSTTSHDRSEGDYHRTTFFSLRSHLGWIVSAGLISASDRNPYPLDIPEGLELYDAEKEAFAAFPVLQGHIRQDVLKFSTFKVTQASSYKVMKQLPIRDVVCSDPEMGEKYNLGQILFPYINHSLGKSDIHYQDIVRKAYKCLTGYYTEDSIQNLLPFVKGFRAASMKYYAHASVITLAKDSLFESDGRWIDIDKLAWRTTSGQGTISERGFDDMYLENKFFCECITLNDTTSQIDKPILQSFFAVLYGLGGMTLACTTPDLGSAITPFEHIRYARLNDFGRYIIGLTDVYTFPSPEQKKLFDLDDSHLIIRSLEPGNPYESLLVDTAEPMGGGRYRMSPETFLAKCKNKKDVSEKVEFFKEYICSDLPKIWDDFFATIARRCMPFVKDTTKFYMCRLDPSDKELAMLISTDEVLKKIVVKAEGYRILIPTDKEAQFDSRLKQFGYLV